MFWRVTFADNTYVIVEARTVTDARSRGIIQAWIDRGLTRNITNVELLGSSTQPQQSREE